MEDSYDKCDDYDLIDWVQNGEDYPDEARRACEILYKRYGKPLFKILRKILGNRGVKEEGIVDLVHDTFYKILSQRKGCQRSRSINDKSFLYWLVTIAQNIYNDTEEERTIPFSYLHTSSREGGESGLHALVGFDPNANEPHFPNEEVVIEYVQSIPEKRREILLAYFDYYVPGKNTPPAVLAKLARRFSTTTDYIRNVKNRELNNIASELKSKILIPSKKETK